ncbi:hypothetical protein [Plantactinospora soyae]
MRPTDGGPSTLLFAEPAADVGVGQVEILADGEPSALVWYSLAW